VLVLRIPVIPTRLKFAERNAVRQVPINLVGGHVHEWGLRTSAPSRLEKIERTHGVCIEIFKGDSRGAIMRRLRSRMDDDVGLDFSYRPENAVTVPDVRLEVSVIGDVGPEPIERPPGVALRPKENGSLVVIYSEDPEAVLSQMKADFRSDQAARAGYQCVL